MTDSTTTLDTPAANEPAMARSDSKNAASAAATFSWSAHPARQRPAQAILALGIVAIVGGFIYITVESLGFTLLGTVLLLGALNRFFLPSRFTLDDEGIAAAYPMRRMRLRWRDVRRFLCDEYGGYLSTRATPSRLDAYRGMHLLFDEAQRDAIIARIKASIGADAQ